MGPGGDDARRGIRRLLIVLAVTLAASLLLAQRAGRGPLDYLLFAAVAFGAVAVRADELSARGRATLPETAAIAALAIVGLASVGGTTVPGALTGTLVASTGGFGTLEYGFVLLAILVAVLGFGNSRILLTTGASLGLAILANSSHLAAGGLNAAVSAPIAATAAWLLALVGYPIASDGTLISVSGVEGDGLVSVAWACNGLSAALFFAAVALAALPALPGGRSARFVVGLAGMAGMLVVNLGRIIALLLIYHYQGLAALRAWHANLGDALFVLYVGVFFGLAHRYRANARASGGPAA